MTTVGFENVTETLRVELHGLVLAAVQAGRKPEQIDDDLREALEAIARVGNELHS
jgi:hypothetical protein